VASDDDTIYAENSHYPLKEIQDCANKCGGMTAAILAWLHNNKFHYKLLEWRSDGVGICAIQKNPEAFSIVTIAPVTVGKNNRKGSRELTQV
jgi:hypothetical protein